MGGFDTFVTVLVAGGGGYRVVPGHGGDVVVSELSEL